MKKLIIISAALMAVALLCGAIDFAKETRNGELAKIYEEKKSGMISSMKKKSEEIQKISATLAEKKKAELLAIAAEKKELAAKEEMKNKKTKISFSSFSRGGIDFAEQQREIAYMNQLEELEKAKADSLSLVQAVDTIQEK